MVKKCLFCHIVNKQTPSHKIYEDEDVYAFLDIYPVADGHTLVVPKKHSCNLSDTSEYELDKIMKATKKIVKILDKSLSPKGYNFISNQNKISYQMIMHFHLHIIPKYEKDYGYLINKDTSKNISSDSVYQKILSNLNDK